MDDNARQLLGRLERDPSDASIYDALADAYRRAGDLGGLGQLFEGWAGTQADPHVASAGFHLAARAAIEEGDRPRAIYMLQQAIHQSALNYQAVEQLHDLWLEDNDYAALCEFLDGYLQILEQANGPSEYMADLYFSLGGYWAEAYQQPDRATGCYLRALELDPMHTQAAYAARVLAEEAGDLAGAAQFYELEARAEQDPARKLQLCARLAEIQADDLDDLDGAVAALRLALSAVPGDIEVMHDLAGYLLRRAEAAGEPDMQRDLTRAAELYFQIGQTVDEERSIEYLEAALSAQPAHEPALAALESLAPGLGRAELLPQHWLNFITTSEPGPATNHRRVQLARAYAAAGQPDDALYCLEEATGEEAAAVRAALEAGEALPAPSQREIDASRPTVDVLPGEDIAALDLGEPPAADEPTRASEPDEALLREASERGDEDDSRRRPTRETRPVRGDELPASTRTGPRDTVQARRRTDDDGEVAAQRLRGRLRELVAARKQDEAAEVCQQLLQMEPTDPEAFSFLEGLYRKRREHGALRDLLMATAQQDGLGDDTRVSRIKQAATLSETKLRDSGSAIEAWQLLMTVAPDETDSIRSLKRLLRKEKRWDELAGVLEAELLTLADEAGRIELLQTLVSLHRDRRESLGDAAEALMQLYELQPERPGIRDELSKALLATEQYDEAVPLLESMLEDTTDERKRLPLLAQLVELLDERLQDPERAYALCLQILELRPEDEPALRRMESIDEQSGNFERLLSTLERRAKRAPKGERAKLSMRMGRIAQAELEDIDRAAAYYGTALDLQPDDEEALATLSGMFEDDGRYDALVELLRERTMLEKDPTARAALLRRTAQLLESQLQDTEGALGCYQELLELDPSDVEALRAVLAQAELDGDATAQARWLGRLSEVVQEREERRSLLFDLAQLQRQHLEAPAEAIQTLQRLIREVDPDFDPAVNELLELCEETGDDSGLAEALERVLQSSTVDDEVVDTARRLADLYEGPLADAAAATTVLERWREADATDVEPLHRLARLHEASGAHPQLLPVLDGISAFETDEAKRTDATLRAAEVAFEQLEDVDGAWSRLLPLVEEGSEDAEQALRHYSRRGGRSDRLANLHVGLAQQATSPAQQGRHWAAAATILRDDVDDAIQAFEAALRMLASDMGDRDYLAIVDQLAVQVEAWTRLAQVYDRLVKQTESAEERVKLLSRHADLLEDRMPSEALDRILRCCALAPGDDELLARAEHLSARTDRSEELLLVYDRRRGSAPSAAERIEYLIRAARLCDRGLADRPRASAYLRQALAETEEDGGLATPILEAARRFDEARPELGADDARRNLARAHRELAERSKSEAFKARLVLDATTLLRDELDDSRAAFDMLRQGMGLAPRDEDVYGALRAAAEADKRLEALDAHLSRSVEDAIEADVTVLLLQRRLELLEGPLSRPTEAVQVYNKLLQLRPDDAEAAAKLRQCLRGEGRFQDVLVAIGKRMKRTEDPEERVALLVEAARTWESDIDNRWEALDAWRKVIAEAPDHGEAGRAAARLQARTSIAPPDPFADDDGEQSETGDAAPADDAGVAEGAADDEAEEGDGEAGDDGEPAVTDEARVEDDGPTPSVAPNDVDTSPDATVPAYEDDPPAADGEDRGDDGTAVNEGAADNPGEDDRDEGAAPLAAEAPAHASMMEAAAAAEEEDDDEMWEDADADAHTGPVTLADLDADLESNRGVDDIDLLAEDLESDVEYLEAPRNAKPSIPPPVPRASVRPSKPPASAQTGRSIPPPLPSQRPSAPPGTVTPASAQTGQSAPPPPPGGRDSAPPAGASVPPPLPPRKR